MPGVNLKALIGQKSASMQMLRILCSSLDADVCVVDPSGNAMLGKLPDKASGSVARHPIITGESEIGSVIGADEKSAAFATLLSHLADREAEQRALASETLTLYREIHLIEQLSEELAAAPEYLRDQQMCSLSGNASHPWYRIWRCTCQGDCGRMGLKVTAVFGGSE